MFLSKKESLTIFFTIFILHHNKVAQAASEDECDLERDWYDPVLGCLDMTDRWISENRPINPRPDTREEVNTMFFLHTRTERNDNTNYEVSADDLTSLQQSPFDASKPTKFVVHGYLGSAEADWVKEMTSALLYYGDYNILRVNWADGAKKLTLIKAAANTRVVGLEISHFINVLEEEMGLDPTNVHCLGHSLGSHTCGYAGERTNEMGRISGLDPSSEGFEGTPEFVRLDHTDALFVDNIHTGINPLPIIGRGTHQPMGNIDFYPNSGANQPGCTFLNSILDLFYGDVINMEEEIIEWIFCSHFRAIYYFIDSLKNIPSCHWIGQECQNYDTYKAGECYSCGDDGSQCAYLGIRADEYVQKSRVSVLFFLDTDRESPFCIHHYHVTVLTDNDSSVRGKLSMTLQGDNSQIIEDVQITRYGDEIEPKEILTTVFTSGINIGRAISIELKWAYTFTVEDFRCFFTYCDLSLYVKSVRLIPLSHYPESERISRTTLACSSDGSTTEIENHSSESFTDGSECQAPPTK